jgi:hypothetical protein
MSIKSTLKKIGATLTIAGATAAACVGCPKQPDPVTPQPPVITDQASCQAACDNLRALGCDEGNPIDTGAPCTASNQCQSGQTCSALGTCIVSCVQFCMDTENAGVWLDPVCVSKITSCGQIDQCPAAQPKAKACTGSECRIIAN